MSVRLLLAKPNATFPTKPSFLEVNLKRMYLPYGMQRPMERSVDKTIEPIIKTFCVNELIEGVEMLLCMCVSGAFFSKTDSLIGSNRYST